MQFDVPFLVTKIYDYDCLLKQESRKCQCMNMIVKNVMNVLSFYKDQTKKPRVRSVVTRPQRKFSQCLLKGLRRGFLHVKEAFQLALQASAVPACVV